MKYIKLILIIPIIFFTNGCYNYRELNELGITTAIGISKENELYKLTIEVLKIDGSEEKAIPEVKIFESSGRTIQEALRHTILDSSKRLYANHLFLLVIDSKLASEGIKDIIDLFFREPESRKQFYVAITDENMNELFNTTTPLDTINANSISKRIESNIEFLANINAPTFSKMISKYVNPNIELVLPVLTLSKINNENRITFNKTAIFNEDKLISYITLEDTLYLNLLLDNIHDTIFTIMDDNKYISAEVNKAKTTYKVSNNTVHFNIKLSGNIAEIHTNIDLTNPDAIKRIEEIFENEIQTKCINLINKIIYNYKTDIFGFKDMLYKNKKYESDITQLNINIKINFDIKFKGNGAQELYES